MDYSAIFDILNKLQALKEHIHEIQVALQLEIPEGPEDDTFLLESLESWMILCYYLKKKI